MRGSKAKALRRRVFGDRPWHVERMYQRDTRTNQIVLAHGPHQEYRKAKRGTA